MKKAKQSLETQFPPDMALTLEPSDTGLPFEIWISEEVYISHHPRFKVYDRKTDKESVFQISVPPRLLAGEAVAGKAMKDLTRYATLNHDLMMSLWRSEIDQVDYMYRDRCRLKR